MGKRRGLSWKTPFFGPSGNMLDFPKAWQLGLASPDSRRTPMLFLAVSGGECGSEQECGS